MKIPYYISLGASALCLVLTIVVFALGGLNRNLQDDIRKKQKNIRVQQQALQGQQQALQAQQEEINAGAQINQKIGPELLRDMATSSVKNEKMKALLAKHGYNVEVKNTPAPATK
jgi:hypothetical protein